MKEKLRSFLEEFAGGKLWNKYSKGSEEAAYHSDEEEAEEYDPLEGPESMPYAIGIYGGSFDPVHLGHVQNIIRAASQCRRLYVVVSFNKQRDYIPAQYRLRWLRAMFGHMDNIRILLIRDNAPTKEADTEEDWQQGRDRVLAQIKRPVDVVFAGSDCRGTNRYENLYGCPVVYFDRQEIPVSSAQIRENPLKYWQYIPRECRPFFVKRVLLVGGESTGKSTLAANLALAYQTNFLEEVGREVCDYAGAEEMMVPDDFQEILLRHKTRELELVKDSNRILFVDTDALTTKFYARFLLDDNPWIQELDRLADAITDWHQFNLVLFLEPTVDRVQDGARSETTEADQERCSRQLKELLDQAGIPYHCLSGDYVQRFEQAKALIDETFGLKE